MRTFLTNRKALAGAVILFLYFLMSTVGPQVIPLDLSYKPALRLKPPSLAHPLGTDVQGCDTLAQIVHGSRDVLLVSFLAAIFAIAIAVIVGVTSGFIGGLVDQIFMVVINLFLTVPSLPVMMVFAAVFRVKNPISFGLILAIWMWAGLARAIRSQVLSLKEQKFIEAANLLRLGIYHIVFAELLPHVVPYVAINFISMMRTAINASIGLMFLGIVPFSRTNWGMMLRMAMMQGVIYAPNGVYYLLSPVFAIALLQIGGYFFAHGMDEIFNPRLRAHE